MRKFFSISREQTPIIITLLIVILLGASYLFIYVPNKDDALQREHFRWLRQVDVNIQKKIEGCDTLLSHLLELYSNRGTRKGTEKYIDSFSKENFTLFYTPEILTGKSQKDSIDYVGTRYSMTVYEPLQTFIISASKNDINGKRKYTVSMQYTFKNFIQPLLNKWIFDHYVVFSNGKVVYEDADFPSGISYNNRDSLLVANKGVSAASIIDQKVGGERYKMFLQPIAFAKNTWILSGLHSFEKYNGEKRNLPWGLVWFLMVIALGLFLLIPLLKIFSLGKNDRLRLFDVIELMLVVKLLMSLVFFCFFRLYKFGEQIDTHSKETLAQKIDSTFTTEVKNAYTCLESFDLVIQKHNSLRTSFGGLGKDALTRGNIFDPTFRDFAVEDVVSANKLKSLCRKVSKPELNWMDNTGDTKYNWTSNKYNNPPANYGYRDYFRMIKNNKPYLLDQDTFYLDQLISRTDGSFRTVISKPSELKSTSIITLGFDLKSLDSVIMPVGYIFAIIKTDGSVLYHSFKNRVLNENLKEEFSDSAELNDALQGRYVENFATAYFEREYNVRIQPIKGLPYFIVVMGDTSYISSRDIETSSFTAGMTALFILFILIDIIFIILASSRRSYFKNRGLVKTWLWPRRSSHSEYIFITLANIVMIALLSLWWYQDSYVVYLFMLLVSIPITTLFTNVVFALKYWKSSKVYRNYKLKGLAAAGVILIIINIAAHSIIGNSIVKILHFQLWCLIYYFLLLLFYQFVKGRIRNKSFQFLNFNFVYSYCLMIFTRIIITSGIPVIFFYFSSFNYEQNLIARYRTYDFANRLVRKIPSLDLLPAKSLPKADSLVNGKTDFTKAIYTDEAWIKDFSIHDSSIVNTLKKDLLLREDSATAKIYNLFSLYNENLPANNDNFYLSRSSDSSFYYNDFFKDVLYNNQGSKAFMRLKSGNFLQVNSQRFAYVFPGSSGFDGWIFWILLFLVLIGFYFLIVLITKKVFAIKVVDISSWNNLDEKILGNIQLYKVVFAVGLPGNEKFDYACKTLRDKLKDDFILDEEHKPCKETKKTVCIVDFEKIPDNEHGDEGAQWRQLKDEVKKVQYQYFIIEHFEYKMNDEGTNIVKLNFIENLRLKNRNVLILSTIHPQTFLNSVLKNQLKTDVMKWQ
jgi:hypothetical protein